MNVSEQRKSLLLFFIVSYMPQWSDQKFSTLNYSGGKNHKLEKHIHDIVDIKENKETDLYKAHLEIRKL